MRLLSFFILVMISSGVYSQSGVLSGEILNETGTPLTSSTVVLLNPADSTMQYFGVSGTKGQFEIKSIKSGNYLMQIAFIGYETIYANIDIPYKNNGNFGAIPMMPKLVSLDEVTVTGERIPLRIMQDTIEYDAKAFKVKPDAVVEDLLKKLPGLEVDRAGNIKALGEDVNTVLVDGKEFFTGDTKVATKNIPADALDKVQVYNKKSEESEFTGIEDGVRNQTINLTLDEDKKDGVFGELMAGGGSGSHYQANAKVYRFSDKSQIAALGMMNNINKYGFDFGDYLSFTGGIANISHGGGFKVDGGFPINFGETVPGFASSGAVGFNYSYSTSPRNRYYISYLGSGSRRELEEKSKTINYRELDSYIANKESEQIQRDTSHNINFGIRHLFKKTNNIIIDGGVSFNTGYIPLSSITNNYLNELEINSLERESFDISDRISGNIRGTYMKRINESRTILKISGNGSISSSNSETLFSNLVKYINPTFNELLSQSQVNDIKTKSFGGSMSLTQKIRGPYYMDFILAASGSDESLVRMQSDYTLGPYVPLENLSPDFDKINRSVKPGISLRRSSEKATFSFGLDYNIGMYETTLWEDTPESTSYKYLQPRFNLEYEYKSGRRLSLRYSSRLSTPSANQLLPIVNNFNTLSLFYGNRDLKPEYIHSASLNWWIFDQFSFTSFLAGIKVSRTENKINYARTVNAQLGQEIRLINVDTDFNANANIDFSTPIKPLGIKTNLSIEESYNKGLNIVDDVENEVTNFGHRFSLTFDNRKKEKWDINTGAGLTITNASYSIQESLNNIYYDVSWFGEIRFTPNEKLDMDISADITKYTAQSFDEEQLIPLIGAQITYFFMKNNRAGITLSGFDLLNRNTGITRVAEMNYLRESQSNIIGRYIMLSFKYRLNKFGGDSGIHVEMKKR